MTKVSYLLEDKELFIFHNQVMVAYDLPKQGTKASTTMVFRLEYSGFNRTMFNPWSEMRYRI